MEDEENDFKSKIFFYFRESYYNSMITACKEGTSKFKDEVPFRLYHALALLLNNRPEECINQLDSVKSENNVRLSVVITLMYAHKIMGVTNKDLFHKLDSQMRELRKTAEAVDFYHSAFVLFVLNKPEKAIDYLDKSLSMRSDLAEALILKGWILLHLKKSGQKVSQNITELFELSLKNNKRNLDATLGVSESYLCQNKIEEALNAINKAIVRFPGSSLPLVQKMKIQFALQDWEQTLETMNRIINENFDNLDAMKVNIIMLLCRDANYEEAVSCIKKYVAEIESQEHKNGKLLLENAQLFSKICGRHAEVLNETYRMVETAVQINSEDVECIVELGRQCLLAGRIKDAQKSYKTATKIDETSLKALMGLTLCELSENGKSDQIKKQVDFLLELEEAQNSSYLYLIRAKICGNSDEALIFLKKASDLQLNLVKSQYYSDSYLQQLDPDFMLDVVKEYLQYISYSTDLSLKASARVTSSASATAQNVLKVVAKACPGLYEASYLLAKFQYFSGETTNAMNSLDQILTKIDGDISSDAHLDQGDLTLIEKASIYIELIEAHNIIGQNDEAAKLLENAVEEFQGTAEEARILILSADHAVKRKNVQGAIDLLNKVKSNESYYLQARTKLADILLKHRLDKYAYLQCYQEMVDENPCSESYLLLGDAYMNILEPDDALECYSLALQQNPKDPHLTSKMGKALVETHYFAKAVAFYKDSIKSTQNPELKLELANLYMQLKEYDKAEVLLMTEIESENSKDLEDVTYLQYKTKLLMLLAQTRERSGNISGALSTLKDARDNQNRINVLDPCQQVCTSILAVDPESENASVMMADIAFRKIDFDMALFHFTQLITKQPTNWTALVRLVEIMRRTGNLSDVPEYLNNAEKHVSNPLKEPGFVFCSALYQWYSGNLNGALRHFNMARQDHEWGQQALYNMIEICLNPDDEMLGDQFMDSEDIEYRDSRSMALKTADRLLKELKYRLEANGEDMLKYKLLTNFRLLATQEKHNIERGLEEFIAIGSQNVYKDHVGPILGMSTAYTLLKQSQRAKNQLKRVAKAVWTFDDAEYLERCWLLLADYYIQSAKFDVASDLLNKVVQHNKACSKAYEYLGFISEKEQHFKDAASNYESAWRFGGKSNPGIGFKLAYSLMKCKNYADAIDIGQQVLKLNPDYPKVKKDILDKSMNNLRI
ncbi:tetratricopeptide repeat protein 21B-like [Asbolus verrucosus]|uniref:Tetratricopeptide repeat protein 21B-like n=1 Tax=Asbolus verrucosus TaxID=1661398 RepID=A0A482WAJ7_ASBVE|nr:tetratricopeptide repeat protein 21B-like [Asbolus verrucosus]